MRVVINVQKVYALIVAYMLSFLALLNLVNAILNRVGIYTVYDTAAMYGLLVGLVGLGLVLSVIDGRAVKLDDMLLFAFLAVSFFASGLMRPENTKFLFTSWTDYGKNPIYVVFLYSFPGYYFVRRLCDYELFKRAMAGLSYAVVVMSVIVFFAAKDSEAMQYMTFSYNMLTQLLFLCMYPPRKFSLLHFAITSVGAFVFVVGGSRGAMLSFILLWAVSFFVRNQGAAKKVLLGAVLAVGVIALAVWKEQIFRFVADVLDQLSIDSRTFQLMVQGELLSDNPRELLYSKTFSNIGIWGSYVMSDRILLDNAYPHNLFLELLYHFGWIIGSLLILAIIACLFLALKKRHVQEFPLVLMLLPCGFIKLMLTGSYLHQEPAFYVLLGVCMNSILRGNEYADPDDQYSLRSRQYR